MSTHNLCFCGEIRKIPIHIGCEKHYGTMFNYRIYPEYWDTSIPYHACPKIWKSPFSYLLIIATDKRGCPHNIFSYLSMKTYVVGTH